MHYDHKTDRVVLPTRELVSLALTGSLWGSPSCADIDTRRASKRGAVAFAAFASSGIPLALSCTCEDVSFLLEGHVDGLMPERDASACPHGGGFLVELVRRVPGSPAFYARSPRKEDTAELCCLGYMAAGSGEDREASDASSLPVTLRLCYERGSMRTSGTSSDEEPERAYVEHTYTQAELAEMF